MATDGRLADAIRSAGFPPETPVSLATVDASGTVNTGTAGQWPDGRAVIADDRFYAASLTKQITAAATALLVREGRLDPDRAIGFWLPGLPNWGETVTTRQLLHHISGLPPAGMLESRGTGAWTTPAVLDALAEVELSGQGTHAYSNAGYILLAEIIAAVSGETYPDYVQRRLGVRFSFDLAACPQSSMMAGHLPLSLGDGGLWITASDFAAWLHRCNQDRYGIEGLVTAPGQGAPDYAWGLGVRSFRGHPIFVHGGSWPGAVAHSVRCPALGIGVVAMASAGSNTELLALVNASLALLAGASNTGKEPG